MLYNSLLVGICVVLRGDGVFNFRREQTFVLVIPMLSYFRLKIVRGWTKMTLIEIYDLALVQLFCFSAIHL